MRCSAVEPAGGSIPIWRANVDAVGVGVLAHDQAVAEVEDVEPGEVEPRRTSARCPGTSSARRTCPWPPSAPPPGRPRRRCPAPRSASRASRRRTPPSRRAGRRDPWPPSPSDAHHAVGRPRGGDRVEILVRQRLEVGGHDGLRASSAAMPGQYRPAPCASRPDPGRWGAASACSPGSGGCGSRCRGRASRTATRGRSRPATGSCSSTPARYEPGSLGHLERALDQVRLKIEDIQLVVITHAHADHCGQAHPIADRAGCEVWAHPNHQHFSAYADDPEAAHAPPRRDRAPERRAEGPAAPRPLARRRPAPARPRPAARPRRRDRPRAPGRCTRRPATRRRTSCLFQRERRLLISGDHLLGRVSLYFDYGYTPDPVGEFLGSLDTVEALGARLALSGHGRPFADVAEHIDANRRLVAAAARRRARGAPGRAVDRLRPAAGRLRRGLRPATWRAGC